MDIEKLREEIAKTCYQYSELIDDKDIKQKWYDLWNREKWFEYTDQILAKLKPLIEQAKKEGWELQDKLLSMTILNQNAPKIVLTNDECGWNISYYPDPPSTEGEISMMEDDPLEVVRALEQALQDKE